MHELVLVAHLFNAMWNLQPERRFSFQEIQFSLDALNREELKTLRLQVTLLAHFEARLENCGYHPQVERRAVVALQKCIATDTLNTIVRFFRQQKSATFKLIAESKSKAGKERIDCSKPSEQEWLSTLKPLIEQQLREIEGLC